MPQAHGPDVAGWRLDSDFTTYGIVDGGMRIGRQAASRWKNE